MSRFTALRLVGCPQELTLQAVGATCTEGHGGGDTGEPSSVCHPEMSLQAADLCEISAPEALSPLWGLVVKQAVVC